MSEIIDPKAADVISSLKKLEKVGKVPFMASSNTSRISTMVNSSQLKDSDDKLVNDLDEAGITIGLSGKIYAQRVDALHEQTHKVLSNLTIASKPSDISANDAIIDDDDCVYGDTSEDLCQEYQAVTPEYDEWFSVDKDENLSDARVMEKPYSFMASMETAKPDEWKLIRIADEDEHVEVSSFDDLHMANAPKKDETVDPVSMAMLAERDHNGQVFELLTRYTSQTDKLHLDYAQFISDSAMAALFSTQVDRLSVCQEIKDVYACIEASSLGPAAEVCRQRLSGRFESYRGMDNDGSDRASGKCMSRIDEQDECEITGDAKAMQQVSGGKAFVGTTDDGRWNGGPDSCDRFDFENGSVVDGVDEQSGETNQFSDNCSTCSMSLAGNVRNNQHDLGSGHRPIAASSLKTKRTTTKKRVRKIDIPIDFDDKENDQASDEYVRDFTSRRKLRTERKYPKVLTLPQLPCPYTIVYYRTPFFSEQLLCMEDSTDIDDLDDDVANITLDSSLISGDNHWLEYLGRASSDDVAFNDSDEQVLFDENAGVDNPANQGVDDSHDVSDNERTLKAAEISVNFKSPIIGTSRIMSEEEPSDDISTLESSHLDQSFADHNVDVSDLWRLKKKLTCSKHSQYVNMSVLKRRILSYIDAIDGSNKVSLVDVVVHRHRGLATTQQKELLSLPTVFSSILLLANENNWILIPDDQNADVYIERHTHEI